MMVEDNWEIISRKVSIAGRIFDKNNVSQKGVWIKLTAEVPQSLENVTIGNELVPFQRSDQTYSRWDGIYFFLDVPRGKYTLSIQSVGKETDGTLNVSVTSAKKSEWKISQADYMIA